MINLCCFGHSKARKDAKADSLYPIQLKGRNVRLLRLHPGSGTKTITGDLVEENLDNIPPFEALSYVWGDPAVRKKITCNGKSFKVTVNLYNALQLLRHESAPRLLWADAVCINQNDIAERSEQVQIMGDIYRTASRVVVCLGPEDEDDASLAVSLVQIIYDACNECALSQGQDVMDMAANRAGVLRVFEPVGMDDIKKLASVKHPNQDPWAALARIFTHPWFTRIWCVQEIILARDSVVLVGRESVQWKVLGVCVVWLSSIAQQDPRILISLPLLGASFAGCYWMFVVAEQFSEDSRTLVDMLDIFDGFEATDPRDRIYGLLGLITPLGEKQSLLEVDYNKSLIEVQTDVAIALLRDKWLKLFSYVTMEEPSEDYTSRPSWVPDWTKSSSHLRAGAVDGMWKACGEDHSTPDIAILSKQIVTVAGVTVDTVKSVRPVMRSTVFLGLAEVLPSHPFIDLWREISTIGDDPGTQVVKMAVTLNSGMGHRAVSMRPEDEEMRNQVVSDFIAYTHHEFSEQGILDEFHLPTGLELSDAADWEECRDTVSRTCVNRRVFQVSGGKYGLGPAAMEEGDIVVVLYGGEVPFILRPGGDEDFLLVGDCYMYDIMNGEVFDVATEERKFRLK